MLSVNDLKAGMEVRVAKLEGTTGMVINPRHLDCRRAGETVTVRGHVPGHGGDVWFCAHANGDVAAYCYTELELVA